MEPERRIEKWLRAFAKKRREQAGEPMELHPAARQRLQREIARRGEETSRGGFFSTFFLGLRPRLVFAVCFIALAVGAWFLIPQLTAPRPATLSMNNVELRKISGDEAASATPPPSVKVAPVAGEDKKLPAQTPPSVATAPQPAAPTVASLKRETVPPPSETTRQANRAQNTFAQKEVTVTTAAASAPATPAPSTNTLFAFRDASAADSITASGLVNKDTEGSLRSVAIPPASNFVAGTSTFADNQKNLRSDVTLQPSAALPAGTALYDAEKTALAKATPTTSQIFNRLEPATTRQRIAGITGTPTPVLASFRVEQTGNNMKVVDADGSVYTGSVQIAQQASPAGDFAYNNTLKNAPATATIPAARRAAQVPAQQNYFFRVAGTNRALNQNVVFSGNFVPLTNSQLAGTAFDTRANNGVAGGGGGGGGGGPVGSSGRPIGGFGGIAPAGTADNPTTDLPLETPLSNSGINGTVVIGDQKAVDVIATPVH